MLEHLGYFCHFLLRIALKIWKNWWNYQIYHNLWAYYTCNINIVELDFILIKVYIVKAEEHMFDLHNFLFLQHRFKSSKMYHLLRLFSLNRFLSSFD